MATEDDIRGLLVDQLGVSAELIDQLQMIDLALALGDTLGVAIPLRRLRQLRSYRDLARAARDALNERLAHGGDFYVRARLRAGDVNVVRVGALTPAFAAALADDLRQAAAGARVEIAVPDDVSDASLATLRLRLAWLLESGALLVQRAADLGPEIPVPWDRMPHPFDSPAHAARCGLFLHPGIAIASETEDQPYERRRFQG